MLRTNTFFPQHIGDRFRVVYRATVLAIDAQIRGEKFFAATHIPFLPIVVAWIFRAQNSSPAHVHVRVNWSVEKPIR
jgi:hypothetical protein